MSRPLTTSFWLSFYRLLGNCLYPLAVLVSWAATLLARLRKGEDRSFRERLGFYPMDAARDLDPGRTVWVHAASAGEVNAVTPLCRELKNARPAVKIVITTSSRTGRRAARESKAADHAFFAPLDLPICVSRAFRAFRPALLIVAETEFWPSLLDRAATNDIPLVLVNGRLSDRHFPAYRRFRFLFRHALSRFSSCLMQTRTDAEKIQALGVAPARVDVAGQLKYDVHPPDPAKVEAARRGLGLRSGDILFTLGSVREGEEDSLIESIPGILGLSPKVRVLLAPRHLKNASLYAPKLKAQGLQWRLRTTLETGASWRVLVMDAFGELAAAYALSRGVFVGGTLVPIGGHNLVEPALSKVPLCFGPHVGNVREAADALLASGGGVQVKSASELPPVFARWLDEAAFQEDGGKAFQAVHSMQGAALRTLRGVLRFLPE